MKWPQVQLRQVTSLGPQYGANASAAPWTGTRPRYIRITDIGQNGRLLDGEIVEANTQDTADYALAEGDLLFARSGNTVGKTYRHDAKNGDAVFAGYLIRFRLNPKLANSKFVLYFTQSPSYKNWVVSKKRVAGQPNVNGTEYSALNLPLPSPREQNRIVELLEQADALRQKRAEADALADGILPALFHKLFGDSVVKGNGWSRPKLGELLSSIDSGWSPVCESREARPDEWGVLKLGAVTTNRYSAVENKALPTALDPIPDLEVRAGDLLFTRKNTYQLVGACAYVRRTRPKLMLSDMIFRLNLKPEAKIHPVYLWALLASPAKRPAIQKLAGGSAGSMPNISKGRLETLEVEKPPYHLQEAFANAVTHFESIRDGAESASQSIETLFASMLHRAFTGELTAKWREAHLKELLAEMEQQAKLLNHKGEKP